MYISLKHKLSTARWEIFGGDGVEVGTVRCFLLQLKSKLVLLKAIQGAEK